MHTTLPDAVPVRAATVPVGFDPRRARVVVAVLAIAAVGLAALFMTYDLKGSLSFALELRSRKLMALVLVGVAIAHSSVLFHTMTQNRILTPSLIGFDALYELIQISAAWFLGTQAFVRIDVRMRFAFEVVVMLVFAFALHRVFFTRQSQDLFLAVLVGIVLGAMFTSLGSLVSRLIDPNEYITLQDLLFANFSSVERDLLGVSTVVVIAVVVATIPLLRRLDVLALGTPTATNLGVDHRRLINLALVAVVVLVSVATALVGPMTFLGLLVSNLAYRLTGTFRHRYTLATAGLIAVVALVGGQFLLERVFHSTTRLSIIVSFIGGLYFIVLLFLEGDR